MHYQKNLKTAGSLFLVIFCLSFVFFLPQAFARGGCFAGDVNIKTPSGDIPISQLKSGDTVVSYNPNTNQTTSSQISNISVFLEPEYYVLNGTIKVTSTHPFYVIRQGEFHIVEVKDLKIGDHFLTSQNKIISLDSINIIKSPLMVYNLEDVLPNNSYFANDILVHNKGGGGCFLPQTLIETPHGTKPISKLNSGDQIISWNETNHQRQVSKIGRIDIFEVDDYYLLNHQIGVTATHPFYVQTSFGRITKEVSQLAIGDMLLNGDQLIALVSIDHINKPATVYNLVDVTPNNNYFADGVLVHNKGGGGGFGGSSGGSSSTPFTYAGRSYTSSGSCTAITDATNRKNCQDHFTWQTVSGLGWIGVMLVFYAVSIIGKAKKYIRVGQTFTANSDLINYTQSLVPGFQNKYDPNYSKDDENWSPMVPAPEVSPALYQNLAMPEVLRSQVQKLYETYESDWTHKNFDHMKSYIKEPYFSQQKQIFDSSFGSHFDVTYQPKILSATPLKVDLALDGENVKLQINGEMIDFEVSPSGTVMSGLPDIQQFTEYWHVFVDINKNMYIVGIDN